jgi:hypothetical protein
MLLAGQAVACLTGAGDRFAAAAAASVRAVLPFTAAAASRWVFEAATPSRLTPACAIPPAAVHSLLPLPLLLLPAGLLLLQQQQLQQLLGSVASALVARHRSGPGQLGRRRSSSEPAGHGLSPAAAAAAAAGVVVGGFGLAF